MRYRYCITIITIIITTINHYDYYVYALQALKIRQQQQYDNPFHNEGVRQEKKSSSHLYLLKRNHVYQSQQQQQQHNQNDNYRYHDSYIYSTYNTQIMLTDDMEDEERIIARKLDDQFDSSNNAVMNNNNMISMSQQSSSLTSLLLLSNPYRTILFSISMIISGAVLGPFLDSYHSAFGVLTYDQPMTAQLWSLSSDIPALITTRWVPTLFGLAGFIIGWLYIILDHLIISRNSISNITESTTTTTSTKTKTTTKTINDYNDNTIINNRHKPSLFIILLGISLFTFQYWLSGIFYYMNIDRSIIFIIMSIISYIGYMKFDSTLSGLITSIATAIGGPFIELLLLSYYKATTSVISSDSYNNIITTSWLFDPQYGYHYNDLGETGYFPLWILPVYFLGGPAVGNLARGIWNTLSSNDNNNDNDMIINSKPSSSTLSSSTSSSTCSVCNNTRQTPCPNWYVILCSSIVVNKNECF